MDQNNLHNFSMYYHTTIRNIGLYTSLSYATLAYSRVYRNNNPFYDIMLILISLMFLAIAFIMNYFLYYDVQSFILKNKQGHEFVKWIRISQAIFGIHIILVLLGVITLFRSLSN